MAANVSLRAGGSRPGVEIEPRREEGDTGAGAKRKQAAIGGTQKSWEGERILLLFCGFLGSGTQLEGRNLSINHTGVGNLLIHVRKKKI